MCVVSFVMMGEQSGCSFSWARWVGVHALARMPWWNCWSRTERVLMEIASSCDVLYYMNSCVVLCVRKNDDLLDKKMIRQN